MISTLRHPALVIGPSAALGMVFPYGQNPVVKMVAVIKQTIKGPSGPRPPKYNAQDTEEEIEDITGHAYRSLRTTTILGEQAIKHTPPLISRS
jgi:hypothetical protein